MQYCYEPPNTAYHIYRYDIYNLQIEALGWTLFGLPHNLFFLMMNQIRFPFNLLILPLFSLDKHVHSSFMAPKTF